MILKIFGSLPLRYLSRRERERERERERKQRDKEDTEREREKHLVRNQGKQRAPHELKERRCAADTATKRKSRRKIVAIESTSKKKSASTRVSEPTSRESILQPPRVNQTTRCRDR